MNVRKQLFLIMISALSFISCKKEDEYDNVRNEIDFSALSGKNLLIAKPWTQYKYYFNDNEMLVNIGSEYNFKSDNTFTHLIDGSITEGNWMVDNDTAIKVLVLDNFNWKVETFYSGKLEIYRERPYPLLGEVRIYLR
jgi:hypothetical protein